MAFKTVIFDIDGTLANTLPICIESYRETLERYVGRPFETEEITRYFGMAEEGILGVYLPAERMPSIADDYFQVYERMHQDCTEPFPGLRAVIERLHRLGVPLAVVTGKGKRGADITLRMLKLAPLFSAVEVGFDEGPNKPASLRSVLHQLGFTANEAVYVGDSAYDIEAASSIGMPVVGAAWASTTTIDRQTAHKALRIFDRIDEFAAWLIEIFPDKSA